MFIVNQKLWDRMKYSFVKLRTGPSKAGFANGHKKKNAQGVVGTEGLESRKRKS